jgi:hypothetical protein
MRLFIASAVGLLCILAGLSSSASARDTNQHWVVITNPGEPTRVVARGAVDASGTVIDVLTLNPDGTFDNLATQVFPDGNLFYHGAGTFEFTLNPRTCHGTGRVLGPFQITGGTGAYAGASGEGVARIRLRFFFDKTETGCSQQPAKVYAVAHASGTLTIP